MSSPEFSKRRGTGFRATAFPEGPARWQNGIGRHGRQSVDVRAPRNLRGKESREHRSESRPHAPGAIRPQAPRLEEFLKNALEQIDVPQSGVRRLAI